MTFKLPYIKQYSIVVSILFLSSTVSYAQICRIAYSYDEVGNRIQRKQNCNSPNSLKTDEIGAIEEEVKPNESISKKDETEIVTLFPNPTASSCVIVLSKEVQNAQLVIYDQLGKVMNYQLVSGTQFDINLSRYASGIYIVAININGKRVIRMVVKS